MRLPENRCRFGWILLFSEAWKENSSEIFKLYYLYLNLIRRIGKPFQIYHSLNRFSLISVVCGVTSGIYFTLLLPVPRFGYAKEIKYEITELSLQTAKSATELTHCGPKFMIGISEMLSMKTSSWWLTYCYCYCYCYSWRLVLALLKLGVRLSSSACWQANRINNKKMTCVSSEMCNKNLLSRQQTAAAKWSAWKRKSIYCCFFFEG